MKTLMYDVGDGRLFIGPHLLDVPDEAKRAAVSARRITMVVNLWRRRDDELALAVTRYHHLPLSDGLLSDELFARYDGIARVAAKHLDEGGNVLVQCYGGRNRSGLLAGLITCCWRGVSGREAVAAVRAGRGVSALNNRHFATWLESLPAFDSTSANCSASK